jgi:glycosyltransferase involved in cell wall biosynthesis
MESREAPAAPLPRVAQGRVLKKVTILTGNHLCHNPRVIKEAACLAAAGYEVRVLGGELDSELTLRDQALAARQPFAYDVSFSLIDRRPIGRVSSFLIKTRRRAAFEAKRWFGWELSGGLGYAARAILRKALEQPADLYIAHSEPALWVVRELHRRGFRVGVDMEDWFSESLLPAARVVRPVHLLKDLERFALTHAAHATCTSHAMAQELANAYGCAAPTVIYNAFPWNDRAGIDARCEDRIGSSGKPSIHWFSQSIGPDRGLETLLGALRLVGRDVEVHLRGNIGGYDGWLRGLIPELCKERVHIHPLVDNHALLSRISEHDIGFAGEAPDTRNHDLTVSNKILHYMLGGLAIVASDTAGQREIAAGCRAVRVFASGNVQSLADAISGLITSADTLSNAKRGSLLCAERSFCWEVQARQLVESVNTGLSVRDARLRSAAQ